LNEFFIKQKEKKSRFPLESRKSGEKTQKAGQARAIAIALEKQMIVIK
jgi:hypothetical protein